MSAPENSAATVATLAEIALPDGRHPFAGLALPAAMRDSGKAAEAIIFVVEQQLTAEELLNPEILANALAGARTLLALEGLGARAYEGKPWRAA